MELVIKLFYEEKVHSNSKLKLNDFLSRNEYLEYFNKT
jgi:hypothetical protein